MEVTYTLADVLPVAFEVYELHSAVLDLVLVLILVWK